MYYNNKKLVLSIFWVVLGAALLILSLVDVLDSSIYAGMGGGLIAVGALQIVRNLRYRKNEQYREKIDTEVRDERNQFIRNKSWAWTGYILIIAEAVASLIALIAKQEIVQQVLLYTICGTITVYWVTYMILSRKY